jgi:hypothetical protein
LAFAVDKGRVWILGKKSRQLMEFRLEDPLRLLNRFDLDPILKSASAAGLALDKNHVLLLTDAPFSNAENFQRENLSDTAKNIGLNFLLKRQIGHHHFCLLRPPHVKPRSQSMNQQ